MSIEANKQVVRDFMSCMNRQDAEAGLALLAPGMTWWSSGDRKGGATSTRDQMGGAINAFYGAFRTPPQMNIIELTAEDDRVSVRLEVTGGVSHKGVAYANDLHLLARVHDGKITQVYEYLNVPLVAPIAPEIQAAAAQ